MWPFELKSSQVQKARIRPMHHLCSTSALWEHVSPPRAWTSWRNGRTNVVSFLQMTFPQVLNLPIIFLPIERQSSSDVKTELCQYSDMSTGLDIQAVSLLMIKCCFFQAVRMIGMWFMIHTTFATLLFPFNYNIQIYYSEFSVVLSTYHFYCFQLALGVFGSSGNKFILRVRKIHA